jgi:hypothetical protein
MRIYLSLYSVYEDTSLANKTTSGVRTLDLANLNDGRSEVLGYLNSLTHEAYFNHYTSTYTRSC